MKPHPPLGVLYLCSHLRDKGFQVEVFDSTFSSRADLFEALQSAPPTALGIYSNLGTRPSVVQILKTA
ncbi:MAG TPA: B12-binding domain-containing radical SAM protein, partial [Blastocatellia bacterium]|nr:B12-binding domain-containing radical SAM protein [Blastocatellia bacterium]